LALLQKKIPGIPFKQFNFIPESFDM
jgi:hypothetical protein